MPYKDPEAQREYMRLWIARRRAAWFADKSCVDCGGTDRLELDHVNRADKVEHRIWSWSKARRDAELAKCVVRCRPCHEQKGRETGDLGSGARGVTFEQVQEIRSRYAAGGVTQVALATEYGCGQSTVSDIVRRVTRAIV